MPNKPQKSGQHTKSGQQKNLAQHNNPRAVALSSLRQIRLHDQYANLILPARLAGAGLSSRDARLVTTLVYGSLRWQGFCDAVIDTARGNSRGHSKAHSQAHSEDCSPAHSHAHSRIDANVRDILRLGVYQLLFLKTPAYAAVSTSCALAAADRSTKHAVGFVNALLRTVSRRSRHEWESLITSRIDKQHPLERLSVRTSHPLWIVHELRASRQASGYESDVDDHVLLRLLEADNTDPVVTLCARPGLASRDDIISRLRSRGGDVHVEKGRFSPFATRISGVDPSGIDGVKNGTVGVEDEGSQLAALALANAPLDTPLDVSPNASDTPAASTHRWLDLCAGPGGKTALLGAFAAQRDAHLVANEPQEQRARLVESNVRALPDDTVEKVTRFDGRDYATDRVAGTSSAFDRVLVDAPCSGLGALRRRPEARWHKSQSSLADLSQLQQQLLTAGLNATRHGGVCAYVTCSPVLEETRHVVEAVCAGRKDVAVLDTAAILRSALKNTPIALPQHGPVQLFSDLHDTDMMFICLLRRH